MTPPLPDAIPAATLVIFRDGAEGAAPELLMVERSRAMAFAGGALVFPGGRVDPGDGTLAATLGGADPDDIAARIAAVRETIEEVGLGIGIDGLGAGTIADIRRDLQAGIALGPALEAAGATLDPKELVPFSRWRPAHPHRRIFDTRFYLAHMPDGSPQPTVDATENIRLLWTSARSVLADADAGRVHLIFPTRRNLERLALFASFADAVADARARTIRTVTPWTEDRGGVPHLCIPADQGYPITSEPLSEARRG